MTIAPGPIDHPLDQSISDTAPAPRLFRAEAMAQATALTGNLRLARRPMFTAATLVAVGVATAGVLFVWLAEFARQVTVPGLIGSPSGSLQVLAPAGGVIDVLSVSEGERVTARHALLALRTGRATSSGESAALMAARIADRRRALEAEWSAQSLQAVQQSTALQRRIANLNEEIRQLGEESITLQSRLQLMARSTQRHEILAQEGFLSSQHLQQRQEDQIEVQARLHALSRMRTALERDLLQAQGEQAASETQRQMHRAQHDRQVAVLDQEVIDNEERRQVVLTAPRTAVVTALNVKPGRAVREGEPLMTLIPDAGGATQALDAELFAPSRAIGFVAVGQEVRLRLAAFPYQKFGMQRGQVTAISTTPLDAQELPTGQAAALMQAAHAQEPLYRIKVALDRQDIHAYGRSIALRPGMALEADIQQERRALWEWLLEPLLAAGRRV